MSTFIFSKISSYLRLIRFPNLFTLPGDVFIGFFVSSIGVLNINYLYLALLLAISICLYSAGIILNDYCGIEEDRLLKRNRPFVNGDISKEAGLAIIVLLFLCSIIFAWYCGKFTIIITVVLYFWIVTYNMFASKIPILGPFVLGICRGLNIFLGASVFWQSLGFSVYLIFMAAVFEFLFIFSVSIIAAKEHKEVPSGYIAFLPVLSSMAIILCLHKYINVTLFIPFTFWIAYISNDLTKAKDTREVPKYIGKFLKSLILYQACWLSLLISEGNPSTLIPMVFIFLLYIPAVYLSKYYYSS